MTRASVWGNCSAVSATDPTDDDYSDRHIAKAEATILITELRSPTGLVAVTDALALHSGSDLSDDAPPGRRELIRSVVVLDGSVRLAVELDLRGGASAYRAAGGLAVQASGRHDFNLHVRCHRRLGSLRSVYELDAGDRLDVVLSWGGGHHYHRFTAEELLVATVSSWRRWMEGFHYEGPEATLGPPGCAHPQVVRSLEQRSPGRSADVVAADTDPRGAELGLPIHLDPGCLLLGVRAASDRV